MMRRTMTCFLLTLLVMSCPGAMVALGGVIVDDPFTDGDVLDGADPLDVPWGTRGNAVLSVQNDDGAGQLNGGNAMLIDRSGGGSAGATADLPLGPIQLNSTGDFLQVEFDFRLVGSLGVGSNRAFRGGFFGAAGLDPNAAGTEDKGFFFRSGVAGTDQVNNPPNQLNVMQELGISNGAADGADFAANAPVVTPTAILDDSSPHHLVFKLTKSAGGVLAFVDLDGTTSSQDFVPGDVLTGAGTTETVIEWNQFEYFGLFGSKLSGMDILVDSVVISAETTVIPEPASLMLLGLGAVGFGVLRRNKGGRK